MRWFKVYDRLRCYVKWDRYAMGGAGGYFAHCIDMDLCAVGEDIPSACGSLIVAINGKIDVACWWRCEFNGGRKPETFYVSDVVRNLFLPAPFFDRCRYWLARLLCKEALSDQTVPKPSLSVPDDSATNDGSR